MKITSIGKAFNFPTMINKNNNRIVKQQSYDSFERSNISFKGNEEQDKTQNLNEVLKDFLMVACYGNGVVNRYLQNEPNMDQFCSDFVEIHGHPELCNDIKEILISSGLVTTKALNYFITDMVANQSAVLLCCGEDYVGLFDLYSKLRHKSNIQKYPDVLFHMYRNEQEKDEPNFKRINEVSDFLSETLGAQNTYHFTHWYNFLAPKFNDFKTDADCLECLEYLMDLYPKKIEYLKGVIEQNPSLKTTPEELYFKTCCPLDYLYEENNGESFGNYSEIVEYILKESQIKNKPQKMFSRYFDISSISVANMVNQLSVIAESGISIPDFNLLFEKSCITSDNLLDRLKFRKPIIEKMATILPKKQAEIPRMYATYSNLFMATKNSDDEIDTETIKTIISLISTYNFKNEFSFCNLYNNCSNVNKKELTYDDISEFLDLCKYSRGVDVRKVAKATKTTPAQVLEKEKETFFKVQPEIKKFLDETDSEFYVDLDELEVFERYRTSIESDINNIPSVLQKLAELNGNEDEYKKRKEIIDKFVPYFNDKQDIKQFFKLNDIEFSEDKKEKQYINACMDIFSSLYDDENPEQSKERILQLSRSCFLAKSKEQIVPFLASKSKEVSIKQIFDVCIDKKIPNISTLDNLLKQFTDFDGNYDQILTNFQQAPDSMTCHEYTEKLKSIEKYIAQYVSGKKINNSNIAGIDFEKLNELKTDVQKINYLVGAISGIDGVKNFIGHLSDSYTTRINSLISRHAIAEEFCKNFKSSSKSYHNLYRELKLEDVHGLMLASGKEKQHKNIIIVSKLIPQELVSFLGSSVWLPRKNGEPANLSLHAKMRLLDRFILQEPGSINKLNSRETQAKLDKIFNAIYEQEPFEIKVAGENQVAVYSMLDNQPITAVFNKQGKMITILNKYMQLDNIK